MSPMFPRLNVNDTEKGGPRAPPRNKMALYEQLSVPKVQSRSTLTLPLPPNKSSSLIPSTSSTQVSWIIFCGFLLIKVFDRCISITLASVWIPWLIISICSYGSKLSPLISEPKTPLPYKWLVSLLQSFVISMIFFDNQSFYYEVVNWSHRNSNPIPYVLPFKVESFENS